MLSYINKKSVSIKLTGKKRQPESVKFKTLIQDLNVKVDQYLNKLEETAEQCRQAEKMGL